MLRNALSWIESANAPNCDFPLQNLPFCAFLATDQHPHIGIGIGDFVLDLHTCAVSRLFHSLQIIIQDACLATTLNSLISCGDQAVASLRKKVTDLLAEDTDASNRRILTDHLHPISCVTFEKPVTISNYTDFYASIEHATNVGKLFRPDEPLLPNYKFVPIGYHGRASSIVISGTPVMRPNGQTKPQHIHMPHFGPSQQLDYELEVATYIATGNALGNPIDISNAESHLFGISLLNDWSARDIQSWEYQPLGPFLGKSFATTISPWIVTMSALQPYRVQPPSRPYDDPAPLPYLSSNAASAIDIQLEAFITTTKTRASKLNPYKLSAANFRDLYWTFPQLVAHQTSNGCNLLSGDLIASGTVSGLESNTHGSLLEMTQCGINPIQINGGEVRTFLEDGDEIILRGFCQREGFPRIGLGECRGTIISAKS